MYSRPKNSIQYHQCYCLIRNSQMSHLAHLPLTLKSPPSHTDHHPYFLLIFPIFYRNFSFRNTLISIFGNVIWTLKKFPPPSPNIIPIFFYDCFPYFLMNTSIFGIGQWILEIVGPYSHRKAFTQKEIYQ